MVPCETKILVVHIGLETPLQTLSDLARRTWIVDCYHVVNNRK